jgi:hypothetical protein
MVAKAKEAQLRRLLLHKEFSDRVTESTQGTLLLHAEHTGHTVRYAICIMGLDKPWSSLLPD